ncbi:hypothetical protein HYT53_01575 [Candidatus Woesearchaeota archaeon]|nr:hypothetical protein [Candidatus Woesearchaeota archaeon]
MGALRDVGQRLKADVEVNSLVSRLAYSIRRELLNYALYSHGIPVPKDQHAQNVEFYVREAIKKFYKTSLDLIPSQAAFLYFPK